MVLNLDAVYIGGDHWTIGFDLADRSADLAFLTKRARPASGRPDVSVTFYRYHQCRVPQTDIFHGARISDVRSTVKALKQALADETPLAMVGYSMGGIIGANYAAISGDKSGLRSCVSMSGSFDTRYRSMLSGIVRVGDGEGWTDEGKAK